MPIATFMAFGWLRCKASKNVYCSQGTFLMKHVCEVCGWIYDEAASDPEHGSRREVF